MHSRLQGMDAVKVSGVSSDATQRETEIRTSENAGIPRPDPEAMKRAHATVGMKSLWTESPDQPGQSRDNPLLVDMFEEDEWQQAQEVVDDMVCSDSGEDIMESSSSDECDIDLVRNAGKRPRRQQLGAKVIDVDLYSEPDLGLFFRYHGIPIEQRLDMLRAETRNVEARLGLGVQARKAKKAKTHSKK
ncbi:MAG: hypothetical protein [Cressdnaviricota sp.]|nr:MAG: hypothetical protein [Cressdnaviricota sp.]